MAPGSASGINADPEADYVAVSIDDGESWTLHPAPGNRDWEEVPRWVEPLAWDSRGVLYSAWSEGEVLRLGISRDGILAAVLPIQASERGDGFPWLRFSQ